MRKNIYIILLLAFLTSSAFGQMGKKVPASKSTGKPAHINLDLSKLKKKSTTGRTFDIPFLPKNLGTILPSSGNAVIKNVSPFGIPTWIEGEILKEDMINRDNNNSTFVNFFTENKSIFKIEQAENEFVLSSELNDGISTHLKYQQFYKGVEVWNSEVMFHLIDGKPYLFNGRMIPTPEELDINPSITLSNALEIAQNIRPIQNYTDEQLKFIPEAPISGKLVIYTEIENSPNGRLAYHIIAHPNLVCRYEYFIDANSGDLINEIKSSCSIAHNHDLNESGEITGSKLIDHNFIEDINPPLDGPATATASDLNGTNRTINTYLKSGSYYLIDASRPMYNNSGNLPDDPKGAIWTIDAGNKSPENSNFSVNHVSSTNNTWSSKTAVSAHYNGGIAYDYFRTRFNRNSINGSGGTIISIINVTESDGSGMDNAFWNGSAMFYGNGNTGFKPLAGALDVAGHEMSHGVIQETANLTYEGESGAMNESFADVFGVLIDRDDYKLGEEVVKLGEFPSGALRDVSNPHNGGSSLNDGGYQPAHMNEKYNGSQDNGGVHINSGILNFAFFKIATSLGKDDAEKIYYAALSKYLTKSSQFIDCRNAVIQAAKDLYGAGSPNISVIENSFAAVGIGQGGGTTTPPDYEVNPGEDFIIYSDANLNKLNLIQLSNNVITELNYNNGVKSKPSVSDDGTIVVFVGDDNVLYYILFDWQQGQYTLDVLDNQNQWRNAVISKDGNRLAGLLDVEEPYVYVFNLLDNKSQEFELFNPTTGGTFTGDVEYADAMEFDHTGEYLMYDALSSLGFFGTTYWDIGFVNVWNNNSMTFGDGNIDKLFSSLPDGVSVGNPVFSKNSPNVIAFDYIEEGATELYQLWGANIETGNTALVYDNLVVSYPCFSKDDKYIIFNAKDNSDNDIIALIGMKADKINPVPNSAQILLNNSTWGTWFATGEREINAIFSPNYLKDDINVFPNPAKDEVTVTWSTKDNFNGIINVLDTKGNILLTKDIKVNEGKNTESLKLGNLPAGSYFIEAQRDQLKKSIKLIKN